MRWVLPILTLLIVGCGSKGTPEDSLLEPGSQVVVVPWDLAPNHEIYLEPENDFMVKLKPGVRATVGQDPGFVEFSPEDAGRRPQFEENPEKDITKDFAEFLNACAAEQKTPGKHLAGDPQSKVRKVKVLVETGAQKGKAGSIMRLYLRPVK